MTELEFHDAELLYDFLSDAPKADHADFILAAGSHDLRVADHAAALYRSGAAPFIVCSGGFGKMTSGLFPAPEAELFASRCTELGVPQTDLILEPHSTNTGENFTFSRELLSSRGIFPSAGIIACKPYMAKRVWATGTKQWSEVSWYVSTPKLSLKEYVTEQYPLESAVQLMVGDLQRCRVYAKMGFQAPVDVPETVWQAYERLAAAGYDRYVIR